MSAERTAGHARERETRRRASGRPAVAAPAEDQGGAPPPPALGALVFFNPVAPNASAERLLAALDRSFGTGRFRVVPTTREKDFGEEVDRQVARAVDEGCSVVIAAGGDGTVSLVAQSLRRLGDRAGETPMAIVPCGTANVLARELEVPLVLEEAVALAAEGTRVVPLDGLVFGDRLFLTQVGIGLDAYMIRDTSREATIRWKRLGYLFTLARRASGHKSRQYRLTIDGKPLRIRAFQLLLANASTLGARPFTWGPDIDPTDGIADLCIYRVERRKELFSLAWMVLTGRHEESPHTQFLPVKSELKVECDRSVPVQGDGELLGKTPVLLQVVKEAVRVVTRTSASVATNGETRAVPATPATAPATENGGPPTAGASDGINARAAALSISAPASTPAPPPKGGRPRSRLRSWWGTARRRFGASDTGIYLSINKLEGGPFIDRTMSFSSRILDWGELWILVSLLAAQNDPQRYSRLPWLVIPPLWATMLIVNFPLKSMFKRRRPFLVHERARLIGRRPKDSSFPSGHTAAAFAGATLLSVAIPPLAPVFWAFAGLVAFSRVYQGVHFPSDVLVGGVVGAFLASFLGGLMALLVKTVTG